MPFDIERFCHSLFAYLYQHYKDTPTCELAAGLPSRGNFSIPDDFDTEMGDSQILVNKTFRPYFRPIFDKASIYVCRSEKSFKDFVNRRCFKISFDSTEVSILTMSAIVSELNLYFLQRDCFRFANFAPRCLAELFRERDTIVEYLTSEDCPHDESKRGYGKLQSYCAAMLRLLKNNPDYVPGIFNDIGKRFIMMKDKPVDFRVPLASTMKTLPEGEKEEEEDESTPLMDVNLPPPSPDQCRYCRDKNCSSYLQQFEREFHENYH